MGWEVKVEPPTISVYTYCTNQYAAVDDLVRWMFLAAEEVERNGGLSHACLCHGDAR
jgi:hypothetical protein